MADLVSILNAIRRNANIAAFNAKSGALALSSLPTAKEAVEKDPYNTAKILHLGTTQLSAAEFKDPEDKLVHKKPEIYTLYKDAHGNFCQVRCESGNMEEKEKASTNLLFLQSSRVARAIPCWQEQVVLKQQIAEIDTRNLFRQLSTILGGKLPDSLSSLITAYCLWQHQYHTQTEHKDKLAIMPPTQASEVVIEGALGHKVDLPKSGTKESTPTPGKTSDTTQLTFTQVIEAAKNETRELKDTIQKANSFREALKKSEADAIKAMGGK